MLKKSKIFVYGTLMEGFRNYNIYLEGKVEEIKRAYVLGELYHIINKDCPALVLGENKVYGEVMTVNDDAEGTVLNKIDYMEKYFEGESEVMYIRKPVVVNYEDGSREELSAYFFTKVSFINKENTIFIKNGDWRSFKEEANIKAAN